MNKTILQENFDLINDSLGINNIELVSRNIYLDSLEDNVGKERRFRRTDATEDTDSFLEEMEQAFMYQQESLEAHGMHLV